MKRVITALLSILISVSAFAVFSVNAAFASGSCGSNASWEFNGETGLLTISGNGKMDDFSNSEAVPWKDCISDIKEVIITGDIENIGANAFSFCTALCKVTMPSSVSAIGIHAFEFCLSLSSLELPAKLTEISHYAFWCSGLESVIIPEGVVSIGHYAFQANSKLKSLVLPSTLAYIDGLAFADCYALKDVYFCGSREAFGKVEIGKPNISFGITVTHSDKHFYKSAEDERCMVCNALREQQEISDGGDTPAFTAGDIDKNGTLDADDAIYLLYHTFFSEKYPVSQPCDFDKSGTVDGDDAIYLLYHIFFKDKFPI